MPDAPRPPVDQPQPCTIAVVGGGISGLAAAHRLHRLLPEARLQLYEAGPRLGGVLHTVREGPWLIETSADNFITKLPWAEDLCREVGLADQLCPTETTRRRALVVHCGRVVPVPEAFVLMSAGRLGPIFTTPLLSWRGKLRLALEPLVPRRRETADESVASFARRRLGREALERLVQPLVGGIYAADPEQLSLQATLPQFLEQEREFGSLWRARRRHSPATDSGARYSAFVAPRLGMSQLVDAVATALPAGAVQLGRPVQRLSRQTDGRWRLEFAHGPAATAAAVVLATPAPQAGSCLEDVDRPLSDLLRDIEYASTSIVALGLRSTQIQKPIEGFGFVVPRTENRQIMAASFASLKFPGRAPDDGLLVRVFVGGALQPELAALDDRRLIEIATSELHDLLGMTGQAEWAHVYRWPESMPQYHLGHLGWVDQVEARVAALPGLELAGNAYRGVGVPQCVRSGEQAAERVAAYLAPVE